MKRIMILLPVLLALQVGVQPALAWTWPVDGPVLRPFVLGDDPYAGGQHRGIDVAAAAAATVRAPVGGTVSFAGAVPGGGLTITIGTADGYSVTLLHLGTISVRRSATVAEGTGLGTVGPTGDPEHAEPYVHLGVRVATDPNGYVDPLGLLPPRGAPASDSAPDPAPEPQPFSTQAGQQEGPRPTGARAARAPAAAPSLPRATSRLGAERTRARKGQPRPGRRSGALPRMASVPPREDLRSFERPSAALGPSSSVEATHGDRRSAPWMPVAIGGLAPLSAAAAALFVRRQLRDARAANVAAPMLLELASAPTEDARRLWLGKEDRLVLDQDLERVLLAKAEPLSDLDRDDDSPELVQVADDPSRHAACRPGHRSRRLSRPHGRSAWPFSAGAHA